MNISKNFKLVVYLLLTPVAINYCVAQTAQDNYIKSYKAVDSIQGDLSVINNKTKVAEAIQYFDGLGRPIQSVQRQGSPLGFDIVSFQVYDSYGRTTTSYLPYASTVTDGNFKSSALGNQTTFYQSLFPDADGNYAFSKQEVESSELGKLMKLGAPGAAWQPNADPALDHSVKKFYAMNLVNEVLLFRYETGTGLVTLSPNATDKYYLPNRLSANKTLDEHNNEVIEYTDKQGQVVCKKVQYSATGTAPDIVKLYASTYYIYDDFGNLVIVLPPEAVKKFEPQP